MGTRRFIADEPKHPDEAVNYSIDWTDHLATGDTVSTSSWTATGLTVVSDSNTTTSATVKVSGGTDQTLAYLENTIVTANGETLVGIMRVTVQAEK